MNHPLELRAQLQQGRDAHQINAIHQQLLHAAGGKSLKRFYVPNGRIGSERGVANLTQEAFSR